MDRIVNRSLSVNFLSSHLLTLFLCIFTSALPLEWKHLMLSTSGSNRGRSLRGLFIKWVFFYCFFSSLTSDLTCYVITVCCFLCRYSKRRKKKLLLELCLEPLTRMQYLYLLFYSIWIAYLFFHAHLVCLLSCHVFFSSSLQLCGWHWHTGQIRC